MKPLTLILCLLLLALNTQVHAEKEPNAQVTFYVFLTGGPLSHIDVYGGGKILGQTDAFGRVQLSLPAGAHALVMQSEGDFVYQHDITLRANEIVQVLVDFKVKGEEPLVDTESSIDQESVSPAPEMTEEKEAVVVDFFGQITSAEGQKGIKGAKVFISGLSDHLVTDEQGKFKTRLNAGTFNISVLHAHFNSQIKNNVALTEAANVLNIELTPAGSELPEFVVVEPYIEGSLASVLEERRSNNSVANYLSMEQISKSGDSDAAGALKRVTGLTLVDGKFIFIRGLGERYSSTLLNGANMPSPDPTRRVVPLDLFPTGIIQSIEVQKGYNASLPAEFGGGSVILETIKIPDDNFLGMGLSYGNNTQTSGKDGLKGNKGGKDWTGFDDGSRRMPRALLDATEGDTELRPSNPFFAGGYAPEELEAIGESLHSDYDLRYSTIDPNLGLDVAGGMRFDLDSGVVLGFSSALEYGSDYQTREELRRSYVASGDELILDAEELSDTTKRNINASLFTTLGAELSEQHMVSANLMWLRSTENFNEIAEGFNEDLGNSRRIYELRWTERDLESFQFAGEHTYPVLNDLKLDWQYTDSTANFDEPDNRIYRYDQRDEGDFVFSTRNDSNSRVWRGLSDMSKNIRYDLAWPLSIGSHDLLFNFGQNWVNKDRDSDIRRFVFEDRGSLTNEANSSDPLSQILNPDYIAPNGYQLIEVTRSTDNYFAALDIKASYLSIDYAFKENFRVTAGVREERFDQSVTTFQLFDPDASPVVSGLSDSDYFPAFSSTFVWNKHQFRLNYSETAARPDFKELSPAQFKDPVFNRNVIGNPELEVGKIKHYDLRWDMYFSAGEFVSLSFFYKEFINPIEMIILPGASGIISFDNADFAENSGVELEFFKDFSFISEALSDLYLSTNFAYIDSEITLSTDRAGSQTNNTRPLQGQSPYVVNVQIGYDNKEKGINASLLFNVFGERISEAGTSGSPDVYEQPFRQLDFVYSQKFADRWKISFKAKNLLDDEVEFLQGDAITRQYKKGRTFGLGVSYDFY
ncbi:TonB-dependent receptor plug domain-containing protein [Marinicella rhabdoformis]|uniref:TonB-dependent receptor plug domain-containing protein n=1 Tax=Marinicella rhabdoformis TaxID=2580566 RepID=UPI0012AEB265|nr:TonB-dependent receptor plug domain-containing protein [Marinicella rhabdoformis]